MKGLMKVFSDGSAILKDWGMCGWSLRRSTAEEVDSFHEYLLEKKEEKKRRFECWTHKDDGGCCMVGINGGIL